MRTLNDYFLLFPDVNDTASAGVTQILPVPDGGRLIAVIVTYQTAITAASEVLTFSTRNAAGTAVAVNTAVGVITYTVAASAVGATITTVISKQSDGTDVVPPGGSIQVANSAASTVGKYRVAVIMRR